MLVLSRKPDDTIAIGDDITITLLQVKGDTVRLGIDAPEDVKILRGELIRSVSEGSAVTVTVPTTPAVLDA